MYVNSIQTGFQLSHMYIRVYLKISILYTCTYYGGTKVTWKIYFILCAHAVANTCARITYYVRT